MSTGTPIPAAAGQPGSLRGTPTADAGIGPTITFAWALGQRLFLRDARTTTGTLVGVMAEHGGTKHYLVRIDSSGEAHWFTSAELDSPDTSPRPSRVEPSHQRTKH